MILVIVALRLKKCRVVFSTTGRVLLKIEPVTLSRHIFHLYGSFGTGNTPVSLRLIAT
jgi:hypothetical protein